MKDDRNANTISLDSDYVQLMTEAITEATQTSFKIIEERQAELPGTFTNLLSFV